MAIFPLNYKTECLLRAASATLFSFACSVVVAQPSGVTKAYLCQAPRGGPVFLVKRHELSTIRDAQCRTVEYRTSTWSVVKRCVRKDGVVLYTDKDLFDAENGCEEIDDPLR